jgi:hypothetical protein
MRCPMPNLGSCATEKNSEIFVERWEELWQSINKEDKIIFTDLNSGHELLM